jgi:4-hydroxy-2-oxoheptanedioate aldolase
VLIGDILRNNVKDKLARDEVVASMTVRLVRTIEIARIAHTAGFDTLYVDLEHSSFSLEACGHICIAALEAGIAPFVRVPANAPDHISRVLDGGALGIIAPHIRSAHDARAIVRAAKFPPLGERSNPGALAHLHFRSFAVGEVTAALNQATMIAVQIESTSALDQAEEIVTVEGIDLVLVGINDLLADWGFPGEYDHPRVREVYAAPSPHVAGTASTAGSVASPPVPIWLPNSSEWARATSRPGPIWLFSSVHARRGQSRCMKSRTCAEQVLDRMVRTWRRTGIIVVSVHIMPLLPKTAGPGILISGKRCRVPGATTTLETMTPFRLAPPTNPVLREE